MASSSSSFSSLSDDLLLHILLKLEDDPRHWPRLSCVSARFSSLIRHVCYRTKCLLSSPPSLLLPSLSWSSLHKLSTCCPGLLHSGVLLDASDFGLEREIGPHYPFVPTAPVAAPAVVVPEEDDQCAWSLFDDLYSDTVYDVSEVDDAYAHPSVPSQDSWLCHCSEVEPDPSSPANHADHSRKPSVGPHLAADRWSLNREQGKKLLASRFAGDALFLTEFPGCIHHEEKRTYMLFRGVFKEFKRSRVWRAIADGKRRASELGCAYCACRETWDLHAAFCLRRVFGYHDDGEPVVRAYVCENGHVSGAWTETPPPCS